jgi:ribA/ribD-fused uncharacterized protein
MRKKTMTINFYSTKADYGCFSNFSRHPVRLKGKVWPTSEHYFQAQKFVGTKYEEQVRKTNNPAEAARMGRDRKLPLRKDWESVKVQVMYDVCYAKFTQHKALKETLLSTGDEKLVEHTENDNFWGDGGDGSGKNMLGIVLMNVRQAIRSEEK